MSDDEFSRFLNPFVSLFGSSQAPLSAAGRMLQRLDDADHRVNRTGITDEVLAAMRRADLKARLRG
jgi:hypothetical protein